MSASLLKIDEDAFWQLVNIRGPNDCWEWQGGANSDGYGYFKQQRTNRIAHALSKGVPKHLVLHTCRNRLCCNPAHLYDGTHADNMRDMAHDGTHDGRNRRSQNHPYAVLTNQEVLAIRASNAKGVRLAEQYGVSPATISSIRHHTRWAYL